MRMTEFGSRAAGGGTKGDAPLRIVHCFRAPVGGIFRHVSDLVEAQHRAGHAVGIICDSTTGGVLQEQIFNRLRPALSLGIKRIPMRRQIAPSDVVASWRLLRDVRSLDPDILHAHGAKGGAYARMIGTLLRASGSRVARIYSPHGGSLHYDPKKLGGRVYFGVERILERMTDALVFVSQFEAEAYRAKVGPPRTPVFMVRNGLRPEEFESIAPAPDAVDFLFIGELRELKGPDLFIAALAEIGRRTGTPPSGVIVGDGPDKGRYEETVRALGLSESIRFLDPMPARQAFAFAYTTVIPSRAESMPYIVLEAIGAAIPLVTTSVGGIPEIFGSHADRLVPPNDAKALAAAMAEKKDKPAAAKAEAESLRNQIRPLFTVDAMASALMEAYRAVTVPRNFVSG
jgi:glycosyltransferase involved in cell wall biosynthesis